MHRPSSVFLSLCLLLAAPAGASAQRYVGDLPPLPKLDPDPVPVPTPPRREGGKVFFGNAVVDTAARTLSVTGWVNQAGGLIEVFACGPRGKTHESAFVIDVNPFDLENGLLALGLKAGEPMPGFGVGPPHGDPVDIFVDWTGEDGTARTARGETFVRDIEKDAPLAPGPWTFTGSVVIDGRFMAVSEETFVASFWDPYAIVNNPLASGSNDDILFVDSEAMPRRGTPITMRFSPAAAPHPEAVTEPMESATPRIRYGF